MLGKRIINSNDAAAGGACTTNTNDYPTTNVAYYKMSTAADEKGTYNGTASNVNFNVQGKYGNAAEFNGSSSLISLPTGVDRNNNFTLSFWVNFDTLSDYDSLITLQINYRVYVNAMANGSLDFKGGETTLSTNAGVVTTGNWYNIVCTKSSTLVGGKATIIYVNGVEVASNNNTSNADNASSAGLNLLGAYNAATASSFFYLDGKLDQVRIFDSALNATQVASLSNEVYCVPTIVPTSYFNSVIYTGNRTAASTTNPQTVGFQPDFTWQKIRTQAYNHMLLDSIRGGDNALSSSTTASDTNGTTNNFGGIDFVPNGVVINSSAYTVDILNKSGDDMVIWNWKAGGAPTATNSAGAGNVPTSGSVMIDGVASTATLAGSIAATEISANTAAGFSIVSFTSNGAASPVSTGHGLSSVPELVIFKNRDDTSQWPVFHKDIGFNGRLQLEDTASVSTFTPFFDITSTTIAVRQSSLASNGNECIAYCFHSVDGYSKIGSYTGQTSGVTIITGFRPRFIMVKSSSNVENWAILDTVRGSGKVLNPNRANAESDSTLNTFTASSTGFSFPHQSTADAMLNENGYEYIFMAFAEEGPPIVTRNAINPFGDSSERALYKFEDDATDAEGNYDATSSPNVTYASGYIDKAAVFNGSSSVITIPTSTINVGSSYTFSMWLNFTDVTAYKGIFANITSSRLTNEISVLLNNGKITIYSVNSNGNTNLDAITATPQTSIVNNTWTNVVVIADRSATNKAKVFFNGVEAASYVYQASAASTAAYSNTQIGLADGQYLDGKLDQVRIFNRALDSGEVTALYNE